MAKIADRIDSPQAIPAMPYLLDSDRLRDQHFWGEAILTISELIAAATGVVTGALVAVAIVSGPAEWAVFSGISSATAVVVAVVVIASIAQGSKERDVSLPKRLLKSSSRKNGDSEGFL